MLALDLAERVERLATLDIIPTLEQFEGMDRHAARAGFHWFFLAQRTPFPEQMINADPVRFLHDMLGRWSGSDDPFGAPALADYERAIQDPETVRAMCDDYRAGIGIDCDLDEADRDTGRTIDCPMLALWGDHRGERRARMMEVWERWATNVEGRGLSCGHFLPEELPEETCDALLEFLR